MTEPNRKRSAIDWEAIERDYRAGILSVREISRRAAVSHTAVQKKADHLGWVRDLAPRIRATARAKLASAAVLKEGSTTALGEDGARTVVEANAALQVGVVDGHRNLLGRLRRITAKLIDGLERVLEGTADENTKLLLYGRSATDNVYLLARAMTRLVPLERQAFAIDAVPDEAPRTDDDDLFDRLSPDDQRQLRASLRGELARRAGTPGTEG